MTEEKKHVSPEFIQNVKKYLEIDDKIKEIKNTVKDITNEKKQYEEFILHYLESIDEKIIDLADGKLVRNISKTQGPLKKELIHKTLTEIVGDSVKATVMTEQIIKSRPISEKVSLKRTTHKNKKSNEN